MFLYFFHNIRPNLAKILPQDHIHFDIFADFQLILITLIGILYFRKKWTKTSKSYHFLA